MASFSVSASILTIFQKLSVWTGVSHCRLMDSGSGTTRFGAPSASSAYSLYLCTCTLQKLTSQRINEVWPTLIVKWSQCWSRMSSVRLCSGPNHQECIPVGCVPSAAVAPAHPLAMHTPYATHTPCHTCPLPHTPSCLLPHMPPPRHTCSPAMHAPPPVNRITDSCKNITFPQLLLWTVMIS